MFKKPLNEQLKKMYMKALKKHWETISAFIQKTKKTIAKNQFDLTEKELDFMKNKCDKMNNIDNWNF